MANKSTRIPLYQQVKDAIITRIESGEIAAGDSAGSESELMKEFGVSQITVRRALSELVSEGYLYRLRGKGTYVSGDRETDDSRRRIRSAMMASLESHPLSEVTPEMISEAAGVDMETLQQHYFSLIDVLKDLSRNELFGRIVGKPAGRSWVDLFGRVLFHIYDHRQLFLNIYDSVYSDVLMEALRCYGESMIKQGIKESAAKCDVQLSEKDRLFMLMFYMCVFMGIIREYFDSRMMESPEYMVSRFRIMLNDNMERTTVLLGAEEKP